MARASSLVQADLTIAYAARIAALNGSYTMDTGQGRQSVTRDLNAINATISQLEVELQGALADEAAGGDSGLISIGMERY